MSVVEQQRARLERDETTPRLRHIRYPAVDLYHGICGASISPNPKVGPMDEADCIVCWEIHQNNEKVSS